MCLQPNRCSKGTSPGYEPLSKNFTSCRFTTGNHPLIYLVFLDFGCKIWWFSLQQSAKQYIYSNFFSDKHHSNKLVLDDTFHRCWACCTGIAKCKCAGTQCVTHKPCMALCKNCVTPKLVVSLLMMIIIGWLRGTTMAMTQITTLQPAASSAKTSKRPGWRSSTWAVNDGTSLWWLVNGSCA